jgi:hypothetical protein
MRARLIVGSICVTLMTTGGLWAGDTGTAPSSFVPVSVTAGVGTVSASLNVPVEPWIHPSMPGAVRNKLEDAFQLALHKVNEQEECGALFARLGADGAEVLKSALYFPVSARNNLVGACSGHIAYTYVGGHTTFVCKDFAGVSDWDAAHYLLHEALHNAGLSEKPKDPLGMTPHRIDRLVEKRCGGDR